MQRRTFLVSGASILGLLACGPARAQHAPATRIARLQDLGEAIDKLGKAIDELGKATDKLGKAIDAATDALTAILYQSRHLVVHAGDGAGAAKMRSIASQLRGPRVLLIWLISTHELISLRLCIYYHLRAEEADGFPQQHLRTRLIETIRGDLTERDAMLAPIKEYCSDVMPEPAGAKLIESLYARLSFLQALGEKQALSTPAALREVRKAEWRHNKLIYQLFQHLYVARDEMRSISQGYQEGIARSKYLDRNICMVFPGSAGVPPARKAARMAALPGYKRQEHNGSKIMSRDLAARYDAFSLPGPTPYQSRQDTPGRASPAHRRGC